jgi:hypothetical protein
MVIVNYNPIATGRTESIPFSAITASTIGTSGTSGVDGTSGTDGSSGTSGVDGTSGTDGSSGTSGSSGTAGTSGTSPSSPYPYVYGLFTQTGDSSPVSATTTETSIIGGGLGSLSVSANTFSVGDSFTCSIFGHISSKNGDTLTIRIKASGGVTLGTIGPITMAQSTNKHFKLLIYFTIRTIGVAGVASIMSAADFTYSKDASGSFEGGDFSTLNNTTFTTTVDNILDITAQWSSSDTQNSIYSEILTLIKTY